MKISDIFTVKEDKEIYSLMSDSRKPAKKALFFCIEGLSFDGHDYVEAAIEAGAVGVVFSKPLNNRIKGITYIEVKDVKIALMKAINVFYQNSFKKMKLFGVCGTSGKTAVAFWLMKLLNKFSACGYIGGLGLYNTVRVLSDDFSVMEALDLAYCLDILKTNKINECAVELSSLTLAADNASFLNFEIGIFTNYLKENLEKSKYKTNHKQADERFFEKLGKSKYAIINSDDFQADSLHKVTSAKILTYGIEKKADFRAKNIKMGAKGSIFTLMWDNQQFEVKTSALGRFSIYNLLAVIATLVALKIPIEKILMEVEKLEAVPGKMEAIDYNQDFNVIVDYTSNAHGFSEVLSFARSFTPKNKRLITVFGASAKQDKLQRESLGKTASVYSDLIILCEGNQRNENPQEIAMEIASGIKGKDYYYIEEREYAIEQALTLAQSGDTVIILGKGHELFIDRGLVVQKNNYKGDAQIARDCLIRLAL